jgi:hypothetical protein
MIVSRSFPFFLKLWKLMLSILTCFLWVGLAFVGFGDDVMIGASGINDVALKDAKSAPHTQGKGNTWGKHISM